MGEQNSIASLRSRVSALVDQEAALLSQAFELSRAGGDRGSVDALFAQVQALQVERNGLQKEIGQVLGAQRLHVASEVWKPGAYEYREEVGSDAVRICVDQGPFGLQVSMPGRDRPVNIETLKGTFEGPLAVDGAAAASTRTSPASSPLPAPACKCDPAPAAPARTSRRSARA
jgi:hypothetical protein